MGPRETARETVRRTQRSNGGRGKERREGNGNKVHGEASDKTGNDVAADVARCGGCNELASQLQPSAAYQRGGGAE